MAPSVFPGAVDVLTNPVAGDQVASAPMGVAWDAIEALEKTAFGIYSVKTALYGAVGNAVTDDSAAIQAAIDAAEAAGGGIVWFPPATYAIATKLTVQAPNVQLVGAGHDRWHTAAPGWTHYENTAAKTALLWTGAAAGTMLSLRPASTVGLGGLAVKGITFIGGVTPWTSLADVGIEIISVLGSEFDVFCQQMNVAGVWLSGNSDVTMAAGESSVVFNRFTYVGGRMDESTGAILKLVSPGVGLGDAYDNVFDIVEGLYNDGNGIDLGGSDSNYFRLVRMQRSVGGTGIGILFRGSDVASTQVARTHIFDLVYAGGGGVVARGTETNTYPSTRNKINSYDIWENSTPTYPSIGTGASLAWKSYEHIGGGSQVTVYPAGWSNAAVQDTSFPLDVVAAGNGGAVAIPLTIPNAMWLQQLEIWSVNAANLRTAEWGLYVDQGDRASNNLVLLNGSGSASNGTFSFTPTVASARASAPSGSPIYHAPGTAWLVIRNTSTAQTFDVGAVAAGTFARAISRTNAACAALGATIDISAWTTSTAMPLLRLLGKTGAE